MSYFLIRATKNSVRNSQFCFRRLNRSFAILTSSRVELLTHNVIDQSNPFVTRKRRFSIVNAYLSFYNFVATSRPAEEVQGLLLYVHSLTGLPWWATIVFTTVCLRLIFMMPLGYFQIKYNARLKIHQKEFAIVKEKLALVYSPYLQGDDKDARSRYKEELREEKKSLYQKHHCHPSRNLIYIWGQLPMWFIMSVTLKHMSSEESNLEKETMMQMKTEGTFWASDLLQPDPFFILPACMCLVNLVIVELATISPNPRTTWQTFIIYAGRVITLLLFYVSLWMPSSVSLYWATSSAMGLLKHLIFLSPKVRKVMGLPMPPEQSSHPYKDLWRYIFRKKVSKLGG